VLDIQPTPSLLHLKTGIAWLGGGRLLATRELAGHVALTGWDVVQVPEGEDYAANAIRVNEAVLIARGFPATRATLAGLGYRLIELDTSEYRKMDGGLSCLSVRW
jgi:dimethylargininase